MKRYEVILRLQSEIQPLIDYVASFPAGEEAELVDCVSNISEINNEISSTNNFSRISELSNLYNALSTKNLFNYCKGETIKQIATVLEIINLGNLEEEDWEIDVAYLDSLTIFQSKKPVLPGSSLYVCDSNPIKSLLYIDFSDHSRVLGFAQDDEGVKDGIIDLLLVYIKCVVLTKNYRRVFIAEKDRASHRKSMLEFLKLYSAYRRIEYPIEHRCISEVPNIVIEYNEKINYEQFDDVLDVMIEYNLQKNILDKYLRIYQVIENFMYTMQICNICDEVGYKNISVSNFKDLSERLNKDEIKALNSFIEAIGDVNINGQTIYDRINNSWTSVININDISRKKAEKVFDFFGICTKNGNKIEVKESGISKQELNSLLCKIIYKCRNSIVHNKANEKHISYFNVPQEVEWLLGEFIVPNLEMIVYGLISTQNSCVMYKQQKISLYEK